jgi:hypothetical protein
MPGATGRPIRAVAKHAVKIAADIRDGFWRGVDKLLYG